VVSPGSGSATSFLHHILICLLATQISRSIGPTLGDLLEQFDPLLGLTSQRYELIVGVLGHL
jgi:hypothetical protein